MEAGNGWEEIAAAAATRDAIAAELAFAEIEYNRALKLREGNAQAISEEMLDERRRKSETFRKKLVSAASQHDALKRGALPEDIALAETDVAAARAAYGLREVRAVTDGFVLTMHKHAGDYASLNFPSVILRMADTRHLRVRLEVSEQEAASVKTGMEGVFTPHGSDKPAGKIRVTTVLPTFAPRRLFEPDSTARMDTRTLQVLCEIMDGASQVNSGQRVLATFPLGE